MKWRGLTAGCGFGGFNGAFHHGATEDTQKDWVKHILAPGYLGIGNEIDRSEAKPSQATAVLRVLRGSVVKSCIRLQHLLGVL